MAVCAAAECCRPRRSSASRPAASPLARSPPTGRSVPILAVTPEPDTFRQLALVWGVVPVLVGHFPDLRRHAAGGAAAVAGARPRAVGDRVVVTAGVPFDTPGTTNLLRSRRCRRCPRAPHLPRDGTSFGVPQIGCDCAVCRSSDPRDRRTRTGALVESDGVTPPDRHAAGAPAAAVAAGRSHVDAVLYTHEHADHVNGIDDLRIFSVRQRRRAAGLRAAGDAGAPPGELPLHLRCRSVTAFEGTSKPLAEPAAARAPAASAGVAGVPVLPLAFRHGHGRVYRLPDRRSGVPDRREGSS